MIMYPTVTTPTNELVIVPSPPSAIADATSTEVPITAPPAKSKIVKIDDFFLKPIPKATKNSIIDEIPKIIPLSFSVIGKKPVSPWPTANVDR